MKITSIKEKDYKLDINIKTTKKDCEKVFEAIFADDRLGEDLTDNPTFDFSPQFVTEMFLFKARAEKFLFNAKETQPYIYRIVNCNNLDFNYFMREEDFTIDLFFQYSLYPKLDLVDIKELASKSNFNPINEVIDEQLIANFAINEEKENLFKYESVKNHKAQLKDKLIVDYQGFINDKPIKEFKKQNYEFILGFSEILYDFDENLIGVKENEEFDFTFMLPEWFYDEKYANQLITFEVKVKKVLKAKPMDLLKGLKYTEIKNAINLEFVKDNLKSIWKEPKTRVHYFLTYEAKRLVPKDYEIEFRPIIEEVDVAVNGFKKYSKDLPLGDENLSDNKYVMTKALTDSAYANILISNYIDKYKITFDEDFIDKNLKEPYEDHLEEFLNVKENDAVFYTNLKRDLVFDLANKKLVELLGLDKVKKA